MPGRKISLGELLFLRLVHLGIDIARRLGDGAAEALKALVGVFRIEIDHFVFRFSGQETNALFKALVPGAGAVQSMDQHIHGFAFLSAMMTKLAGFSRQTMLPGMDTTQSPG